jgi:SNF2 family DNA or RNA helicase
MAIIGEEEVEFANAMALMTFLRQLCIFPESKGYESFQPKTPVIRDLVEDILGEGEKVIIFGWHKEYIRFIGAELSRLHSGVNVNVITGETNKLARAKILKEFDEDPKSKILVANIGTLGEGFDFPKVSNMIIMEQVWNPEVMGQAEDRIVRINSLKDANIYKIIIRNTVDEYIDEVIETKEASINLMKASFNLMQRLRKEGRK